MGGGGGGCLRFLGFDGRRSQLWVVIVGVEIGLIWLSVLSFYRLLVLGFNWFGWWLSVLRSVRVAIIFFLRLIWLRLVSFLFLFFLVCFGSGFF